MFAPFLCSVPLSVAIFFAAAKPPQKRFSLQSGLEVQVEIITSAKNAG